MFCQQLACRHRMKTSAPSGKTWMQNLRNSQRRQVHADICRYCQVGYVKIVTLLLLARFIVSTPGSTQCMNM